jgi:hypothetical protein
MGRNLYLIGNVENGFGVNYFALRKPVTQKFHVMIGFNVFPTSDGSLAGAKTFLEKRNDEEISVDDIKRIPMEDFKKSNEFVANMLKNSDGTNRAENLSEMRPD